MADNDYLPTTESSKKPKKNSLWDYLPAVGALKEQKARIEGTSTSKTKKDTGLGSVD